MEFGQHDASELLSNMHFKYAKKKRPKTKEEDLKSATSNQQPQANNLKSKTSSQKPQVDNLKLKTSSYKSIRMIVNLS